MTVKISFGGIVFMHSFLGGASPNEMGNTASDFPLFSFSHSVFQAFFAFKGAFKQITKLHAFF